MEDFNNNSEDMKYSNLSKNSTNVPDESTCKDMNNKKFSNKENNGHQPLQQIQFQQHYLKQNNNGPMKASPVQPRYLTGPNSGNVTKKEGSSKSTGKNSASGEKNNSAKKQANNRLMNMLSQNEKNNLDNDENHENFNTKIINNFLNFSQNNDKQVSNNVTGGNKKNSADKNVIVNTKATFETDPTKAQIFQNATNNNGLYSQAQGVLSKNGPSKKGNYRKDTQIENNLTSNTKQQNQTGSSLPKQYKEVSDSYEPKNTQKNAQNSNIQGINVLSSKVKKKPPTHNSKANHPSTNNYNHNQVLYNVPNNYINNGKDSNSYSTKHQLEDSKNTKTSLKRPSSAPVKGKTNLFI